MSCPTLQYCNAKDYNVKRHETDQRLPTAIVSRFRNGGQHVPASALNIAYNAALQAATAALAASGYRVARERHHYRTIQSVAYTLGWTAKQINQFDRLCKKRNIGGYETAGQISGQEAWEMLQLAEHLRDEVSAWLSVKHPALLKN